MQFLFYTVVKNIIAFNINIRLRYNEMYTKTFIFLQELAEAK